MQPTTFKELVTNIKVLTPMCRFETPQVLCGGKALFFRRRYAKLNEELEALISLKEVE